MTNTSYFSAPEETLDPNLFEDMRLKSSVRMPLLRFVFGYLEAHYIAAHVWAKAWIAGSGASYQWSAARDPGDLDVLIGVDYPSFRASNPSMVGLSDAEISAEITEGFRNDVQPGTSNWHGYEVTFFVNAGATDIRSINPYAAYDITADQWTVHPDPDATAPDSREWRVKARADETRAREILRAYSEAHTNLHNAPNDAARRNAERYLHLAVDQGVALFDQIHHGRKVAFSSNGEGYNDWTNYRWQAGKESGIIQALRQIKDYDDATKNARDVQTYGMELPDADTLRRRAALYRTIR